MAIGYLTIKCDLVGKSFSKVQKIIKDLEASERVLLQQIFQDNIPLPTTSSEEHRELLQSLHQKLIEKEESGCFSWLINLFKGPWFKSLRIYLGEFKSSAELAKIITAELMPPPKIAAELTPPKKATSQPIAIALTSRQQKANRRSSADFDPIRMQLQTISLKEEELANRIDSLSQKVHLLESAIEKNIGNESQRETNRVWGQVEEQVIRLKFTIKDLNEALELISKKSGVNPSDASKIEVLSSKLDGIRQAITNLDNLLITLKRKIRDREAYNGSVARYNRDPETVPLEICSAESYAIHISGIKEALAINAKDVPILLHKINSIIASIQEITTPPDSNFQFDLEF